MRSEGGITRVTLRPGLHPWVVTSYPYVRALLMDPRLSTNAENTTEEVRNAILAGQPEERVNLIGRNLLTVDPPDHTRMRRIVSRALSAHRLAAMEEPVRRLADDLLDQLVGRQEADLLADYAVPLAVTVACTLIGLPESAHPQFCEWGRAQVRSDLDSAESFDQVSDAMLAYFLPHINSRLADPRDDLVSVLAVARLDGLLDDYELVSIVYQLFFAGHETTASFLVNAVRRLLEQPAVRALLTSAPQTLDAVVEELLRLEGSVKIPSWRFATAAIEIGGVVIQPGDPVLAVLSAANRDEAQMEDPDAFRLDRGGHQHLAFGHGIHHCLGAPLGRIVARVGISRLFSRFPELALACPVDELKWRVNLLIRGVNRLPVRLGTPTDQETAVGSAAASDATIRTPAEAS